jgi:transposase-like protein
MKSSKFKEEQIIAVLREQEAGASTADVYRRHGISSATLQKGTRIMAGWVQGPRVYLWSEFRSMKKYRAVVRGFLIVRRSAHQLLKPLRIENVDPIALAGGDELCLAQLG